MDPFEPSLLLRSTLPGSVIIAATLYASQVTTVCPTLAASRSIFSALAPRYGQHTLLPSKIVSMVADNCGSFRFATHIAYDGLFDEPDNSLLLKLLTKLDVIRSINIQHCHFTEEFLTTNIFTNPKLIHLQRLSLHLESIPRSPSVAGFFSEESSKILPSCIRRQACESIILRTENLAFANNNRAEHLKVLEALATRLDDRNEPSENWFFYVKAIASILKSIVKQGFTLSRQDDKLVHHILGSAVKPFISCSIDDIRVESLLLLSYLLEKNDEVAEEFVTKNSDMMKDLLAEVKSASEKGCPIVGDEKDEDIPPSLYPALRSLGSLSGFTDELGIMLVDLGMIDVLKKVLACSPSSQMRPQFEAFRKLTQKNFDKIRKSGGIQKSKVITTATTETTTDTSTSIDEFYETTTTTTTTKVINVIKTPKKKLCPYIDEEDENDDDDETKKLKTELVLPLEFSYTPRSITSLPQKILQEAGWILSNISVTLQVRQQIVQDAELLETLIRRSVDEKMNVLAAKEAIYVLSNLMNCPREADDDAAALGELGDVISAVINAGGVEAMLMFVMMELLRDASSLSLPGPNRQSNEHLIGRTFSVIIEVLESITLGGEEETVAEEVRNLLIERIYAIPDGMQIVRELTDAGSGTSAGFAVAHALQSYGQKFLAAVEKVVNG